MLSTSGPLLSIFCVCVQFCHRLASGSASAGLPEDGAAGVSPGGGGGLPEQRTSPTAVSPKRRTTCGHIRTEGNKLSSSANYTELNQTCISELMTFLVTFKTDITRIQQSTNLSLSVSLCLSASLVHLTPVWLTGWCFSAAVVSSEPLFFSFLFFSFLFFSFLFFFLFFSVSSLSSFTCPLDVSVSLYCLSSVTVKVTSVSCLHIKPVCSSRVLLLLLFM